MRKSVPVKVTVYTPQTPEGDAALSRCVAQVHADIVAWKIKELNSPTSQKLRLIKAVIQTVCERSQKGTASFR